SGGFIPATAGGGGGGGSGGAILIQAGQVSMNEFAFLAATGGGGGGGGSDCKRLDTSTAQQAGIPTMKLAAAGASVDADCPPSGQITLGSTPQSQQTKNQTPTFVLQANAVHLQPTESGERYVLWLYKSDSQSVPLGQETVDQSGNLSGAVPVPAPELVLFPAFQTIRLAKVSSVQAQQIQQSLQSQGKKPSLLIGYVGDTVLEGSVSDLGLQQLLQQAQSQAGGSRSSGAQAPSGAKGTKG
ncbi:MAG: hypothetical protein ACM31K_07350, partial [Solirubrobacterales bacterium]